MKKYKLAINKNIVNKGNPASSGWVNVEFTTLELQEHISKGYAWGPGILKDGHSGKKPTSSDIFGAMIFSIDIDNVRKVFNPETKKYDDVKLTVQDGYLPLDIAMADPWLHDHALFIHTTPSHTEDHNKLRIGFAFTDMVYDSLEYSRIVSALIEKFNADKSCKNIDRMFFGSTNCEFLLIGKEISKKEIAQIIKQPELEKKEIRTYERFGYNGSLSEEQVAEMLTFIPRRMSYDDWFRIVSAVGNYFDENTAIKLIDNWSPDEKMGTAYKVKHRSDKANIASVIYLANLHGFDKKKIYKTDYSRTTVTPDGSLINAKSQSKEYNLTELGNSERFVDQYLNRIRFNFTSSKWHIWDGKAWRIDEVSKIIQMAKKTVRSLYTEIKNKPSEHDKQTLMKHAIKSESKAQIQAMISLAASFEKIACQQHDFDSDLYLLNCKNGIYNLRSNEFMEHNSKYMLSKCTGANYDPEASCYLFEDSLLTIFNNDVELISFIQRALGLTLCGAHLEEVLFFCYGTGKNGKSVFFNVLKLLLNDYFQKAPTEMLMLKNNEGIPNDIARLPGARLVVAEELPEGRSLNENKVKNLTGGDLISARFLHKEYFDFSPTHTLWIFGNHKPNIKGTDEGIWRRFKLIPFTVTIPESERRPHHELMADFEIELPGILNWVLNGWKEYQRIGLNPPESVTKATLQYRDEQDKILEFINDCCVIGVSEKVSASKLFIKQVEYFEKNKEYHQAKKKFYARIEQIEGVKSELRRGEKIFLGIDLNNDNRAQQNAF